MKDDIVETVSEVVKALTPSTDVEHIPFDKEVFITTSDAAIMFPEMGPRLKSFGDLWVSLDDLVRIDKAKKKMGDADPGLFTRCMKTSGAKGSTNPGAYCAAVHHKITGIWPGEHGGKNPEGPG